MSIVSNIKYKDGKGNLLRSRTELSIAKLLEYLNINYEYNYKLSLNGKEYFVDFKTDEGLIEVIDTKEDLEKFKTLNGIKILGIGNAIVVGNKEELGSLFVFNSNTEYGSIFIEDPSLSFDYAHILPVVEKCSVLHGHTASVIVEIIGNMKDDMVIDFGEAKRLVKSVLSRLDHKFFINKKYIVEEDKEYYKISINGPKGKFELSMPKSSTYTLHGEATIENLGDEIIRSLIPSLPSNVEAVGVYIYEGVSKGAHLISRIIKNG